ncbi:MAG: TlpA disulfide reductase family protein [Terracidiphilus sp.]|nr:TlpA disulfide reductase family protein [Terracidiphilus sp.]
MTLSRKLNRCVLFVFCAILASASPATSQTAPARPHPPAIGKSAPVFVRPALDGGRVDLAALRGKVVLLDFWATWCAPCQAEMPTFANWQRQYTAQGLQVIGVSMDDDATPVRRLATRLKINYPMVMGDEKLGAQYGGILGLPLIYLVGRDGVIRARFQGETDSAKILATLRPLLARH